MFGVPQKIVTDNATNVSSKELSMFYYYHGILLSHSLDYYPQGNGQTKSSSKNLISIMRKLVTENVKHWHKRLYEALWADRTSPKWAIGMMPFELVYGIEEQLSLPLELSTTRLQKVIEDEFFQSALEKRIMYLSKIEEERQELVDHITPHQARVNKFFYHRARPRRFMPGDQVLLQDRRQEPKGAHGKFASLWKGPFVINQVLGPNSFKIEYPNEIVLPLSYNGQDLKLYQL